MTRSCAAVREVRIIFLASLIRVTGTAGRVTVGVGVVVGRPKAEWTDSIRAATRKNALRNAIAIKYGLVV